MRQERPENKRNGGTTANGVHNRSNKVLEASRAWNPGVPACPHHPPVLLVTSRRVRLRSKHDGAHFIVSRVVSLPHY